MKLTHILLVSTCLALAASAHAQIVVGTNLDFDYAPFGLNNNRYVAHVFWTPNPSLDFNWHTGFEYDGQAIRNDIEPSINGSGEFYLVQPGDLLSSQTLGQYPKLSQQPIAVPPGELFLGVNARGGISGELYGWLHLRRGQDRVLRVVSNALAFNTSGILVGTTQIVPEPSAWVIMSVGAAGLLMRRRVR